MKNAPRKKISVIIPMYNSEAYIGQCLQSVVGQTCRNLEILVVDDGSVDKGPSICRELAEADERIQVLRQENQGVSAARNRGLEAARGEYVFFLDSDDAIHPFLLEEMLGRAEEWGAQLAFCGYGRMDSRQLDAALREGGELAEGLRSLAGGAGAAEGLRSSVGREVAGAAEEAQLLDGREVAVTKETLPPDGREGAFAKGWLTADEAGTEEWFHVKYTDIFSGIGGKLILREAIGGLRFDRGLTNGEDTWFLYQLVRGQVRSVYCPEEWYYYREHPESVTNSAGTAKGARYFESARRIRDGEYESGHAEHAMRWEILTVDQVRRNYVAQKGGGCRIPRGLGEGKGTKRSNGIERSNESQKGKSSEEMGNAISGLKEIALAERHHPLFRRICFSDRLLFVSCFACYPLYVILNKIILFLAKRRS